MKWKKIALILLLVLTVCPFKSISYASEGHHDTQHHEEEERHTEHAEKKEHGEHSQDEHKETGHFPIIYLLYWAGLAGLLGISGRYLIKALQGGISSVEVSPNDISLVMKMAGLAIFIYLIDQTSSMRHYHEPVVVGFVKFLLKFAAGAAMVVYSFSGIEEHH